MDERSTGPIRLVLVEDEDLYRDLLRGSLEQEEGLEVVGSFGDATATLVAAPALRPDVALLDVELGEGPDGIQVGLELRRRLPRLGIVILSNHADPRFVAALPRAAVAGWSYLLKTSIRERTVIVRAIQGAARGQVVLDPQVVAGRRAREGSPLTRLSPRQREILQLVAQGLTNAAIAERLVLAEKSVENQLTIVYEHLGVARRDTAAHARVQAVLAYLRESRRLPHDPSEAEPAPKRAKRGASPLTPGARPDYDGDMFGDLPVRDTSVGDTIQPPRERPAAAPTEVRADGGPGAAGRYGVLLVDDQPDFRRAARTLLGGHAQVAIVGEAGSGTEALTVLQGLAPGTVHAVLLDVQMPGMNGFETAQALRALAPGVQIILISTSDVPAYATAAARVGAAFLPKARLSGQALVEAAAARRPLVTDRRGGGAEREPDRESGAAAGGTVEPPRSADLADSGRDGVHT